MPPKTFFKRLRALGEGDDILTDPAECLAYGYDNSRLQATPDAVVLARTHEQVRELTVLCNEFGVPLTARGRGTGTTGASVPVHGGVVVSLERMTRVIDVDPDNRTVRVEPGVTNLDLQNAVARHGFFWPPDPTSAAFCSIGGNLAYNSAGPRAVKYGTPRENTLALRCVTGAGSEIRTGVNTTKGVVGLDLTRLIIGSEGTLAIITEATLKLTARPQAIRTLRVVYRDVDSAAAAVARIMAQPTLPCAVEFMDQAAISLIRPQPSVSLPAESGALLMIEVDGNESCVDRDAAAVARSAEGCGCIDVAIAARAEDAMALWAARKALSPALRTLAPGKINEDIVVPVSRLSRLIDGLSQLSNQFRIPIVNFGHAGNGNVHVNLLVQSDSGEEQQRAHDCLEAVFSLVLTLGGTLSGEHGVGRVKRPFIARELGAENLRLMGGIRAVFDPNGILNPGAMLPDNPVDKTR